MVEKGIIYDGNMEVCCWQMTPEDEARQLIDGLLKAAGWEIWDYKDSLRKDSKIKPLILFTMKSRRAAKKKNSEERRKTDRPGTTD
jgi:hypothetical protein